MHHLDKNVVEMYAMMFELEPPNNPEDSQKRKESHRSFRKSMEKLGNKMGGWLHNK